MLRWMCRVLKKDKIRNEYMRGSVKVASVAEMVAEKRKSGMSMGRGGKKCMC